MINPINRYDRLHELLAAAEAEITAVVAADLLGGLSIAEMAEQHELIRKRVGKLYGEAKRHADACVEAARQTRSAEAENGSRSGARVLQFRR